MADIKGMVFISSDGKMNFQSGDSLPADAYAGCDEAFNEVAAEADAMTPEQTLAEFNELCKDAGLPQLLWRILSTYASVRSFLKKGRQETLGSS